MDFDLGSFAAHLASMAVAQNEAQERGLSKSLTLIQKTARGEFGHYQPAVGPHPAWPELADSTKEDRVSKGYSENDPLLRSGELRDSIEKEQNGLEGAVGSTSDLMPYHEFGTSRAPARPVLGPALESNIDQILETIGTATVTGLMGGSVIHKALGYSKIIK